MDPFLDPGRLPAELRRLPVTLPGKLPGMGPLKQLEVTPAAEAARDDRREERPEPSTQLGMLPPNWLFS